MYANVSHDIVFVDKRLHDFEIRVGLNKDILSNNGLCCHEAGTMGSGETRDFFCTSNLIGQYVSVELINPRMHLGQLPGLTLCEVKVFIGQSFCINSFSNSLRMCAMHEAKTSKICNF